MLKPLFSPDRSEIWGVYHQKSFVDRWEIVEDGESSTTQLQPLGTTTSPPGGLPWQSFYGYEVTHDWWVLGPTKKQLLWLPHHWRSGEEYRRWSGQFLGLWHHELPEVVILEFFE